jgi:hypothetical protein
MLALQLNHPRDTALGASQKAQENQRAEQFFNQFL